MSKYARFDFQKIGKAQKLDNGFLKVPVFATRSGVFNYVQSDGTIVREFRPPGEVFKDDSMETLKGVPLTNRHPVELVDSKNAKKFMVGFTSDIVEKHDDKVSSSVTITDEGTIREVENEGLREVSCGYTCDLEFTPGRTDDGEEFDAIQRNIQYNHLAIVDRGGAGPDVRLRMDSKSAILEIEDETKNRSKKDDTKSNKKGEIMVKIKLDGMEFEVESGLAQAINSAQKQSKADGRAEAQAEFDTKLETAKSESQAKIDEAQAKIDTLETENKELKENKMDAKQIHEAAQKRAELVSTAELVLDSDKIKADMTDLEIKKAVIVEKTSMDAEDEKLKSDAYVEARFDAIAETLEADKADGNKGLKEALGKKAGKKDGDDEPTSDEIRTKNMKADSEAWEKPIGFHLN